MRMRIEKKKLENFTVNYPLELLAPLKFFLSTLRRPALRPKIPAFI